MVLGWRRAFCTSIPPDPKLPKQQLNLHHQQHNTTTSTSNSSTPRFAAKFSFFFSSSSSNPSTTTPPNQSNPHVSTTPSLRCRTTATVPAPSSLPVSPKLQCKTNNSPRFFNRSSNPSSPRSPSTFSLIKSRFSKSRCGICLQSVKRGQGMAIFTAECSHSFHFPCIAAHIKKQDTISCPVCSFPWKEMPIFSVHDAPLHQRFVNREKLAEKRKPELKVYNDDEPLMSRTPGARFNPIPESDENFEEDDGEFKGFFVDRSHTNSPISMNNSENVEVRLSPEAAVLSVSRSYETYAIVLNVRATRAPAKSQRRAPVDLVTVVDVSGNMNIEKLQMLKRAMRLIISSLSSSDRLSIVAFSAISKRLLPLRLMSTTGRRSARRIVEALALLDGNSSAGDAVKKAVKILEDRQERNPVSSILVLSEVHDEQNAGSLRRQSSLVAMTRYTTSDIPVHSLRINQPGACGQAPSEDLVAKCVGGLLSVVVQDLRLQLGFVSSSCPAELVAVYSYACRPAALGSGSIRVGDLCPEEERELLLEMQVPSSAVGAHQVLSVRCSYRDPVSQEVVYGKEQALLVPRPHAVRFSAPSIQRMRNLFVTTRAIAESRRLTERNDPAGAYHMLASVRALMLQSTSASAGEFVPSLEAELAEVQRKRQAQQQDSIPKGGLGRDKEVYVDEKGEPLTPTSAWKVAERLAKVAVMRKSLNRVSDLHGFEDARF